MSEHSNCPAEVAHEPSDRYCSMRHHAEHGRHLGRAATGHGRSLQIPKAVVSPDIASALGPAPRAIGATMPIRRLSRRNGSWVSVMALISECAMPVAPKSFMDHALDEARAAAAAAEVPIGCVIVRDDVIIARAYNRTIGMRD